MNPQLLSKEVKLTIRLAVNSNCTLRTDFVSCGDADSYRMCRIGIGGSGNYSPSYGG